jgi:formin 2
MTGLNVLQSLAEKSPEVMDFHEDLVNLEASSKVICFSD